VRPNPGEMAGGILEIRQFGHWRFQNAPGKNVVIALSDTMTLYVHSGNDKSHLASDYERDNRSSAPTRSAGHYIK
jgi:hypothetical protein